MKVPFVNLGLQYQGLRDEIIKIFDRVSSRGEYILGPEVKQFESHMAEYCGTKYAIGVGNGADALFLSMKALGVQPGDEVITAANSFIASAWSIAALGAKPVFIDVTQDYNIDPELLERAISQKTKAIMPVHLTGRPAAMKEILAIAEKRKLAVIEDSAQAIGATYYGQKTGSFGSTGCFSLHPLKNLHAHGDAGIITTNDTRIYEDILKLRNHGLKNRDECVMWGYNSRIDTIQAGIVDLKLRYLDQWTERYRSIAQKYISSLEKYVHVPIDRPYEKSVFHRFIIMSDRRNELQAYLQNSGIETKVNYPIPLHLQEVSMRTLGHKKGDFPIAEKQAERILSLPIYNELTDEQVDYVIQRASDFFEGRK